MSKKIYKKIYKEEYFDDRIGDPLRDAMELQEMARLKKVLPKKGRVLDIGCGLGEFLSLFDKGWEKYGTEISKFAMEKAKQKGINFKFPQKDNYFDLIVFRGTIQHLNNPLFEIEKRIDQIKPGGYMIFLATPDAGETYYRLFQDLPMLYPEKNFFIPSARVLCQILTNFGLKVKKIYHPYAETPYAHPIRDHFYFALRLLGIAKKKHAFPGNMMEIYAQKK